MSRHPKQQDAIGLGAVSVISFNCLWHSHGRARLRQIAELLEASDADIVCLQEVIYQTRVELLRHLCPSRPFLACEPFGPWVKGGLVTMSRWPVERRRYESFRQCGWWTDISAADRLLRKGFLTTWLRAPWATVAIVNTHLLANYEEDWLPGARFRLQQEDELRQLGEGLAAIEADVAVVAAGDFNVPTTLPAYQQLLRDVRLVDATENVPVERPEAAIDHILVRTPLGQVAGCESSLPFGDSVALIRGRPVPLSDHPAISARVEFHLGDG